jgi:virulence-associated protein VagC
MIAIRIETTISSETLHLPQLKPLMGKSVEIIVREKAAVVVTPPRSDWESVEAAVLGLVDYDFHAYRQAREMELREVSKDGQ